MLMPILAVKPAALPPLAGVTTDMPASASPQARTPLAISGLQSDAVLKIIETLNRHFMGEAVLPQEVLARLVDTLAKALNFPPLPQESTVDFARRLALFIETLPPEARQQAEKQLGLRNLGIPAKALTEALRNPNGVTAARIATVLETAPKPAPGTGARQGMTSQQQTGPQLQLAASLAAALAGPAPEVSALQAALKRTFGADDEIAPPVRSLEVPKNATAAEAVIGRTEAEAIDDDDLLPERPSNRSEAALPRPTMTQALVAEQGRIALPAVSELQAVTVEEEIQPPDLPGTFEDLAHAEAAARIDRPADDRILAASPGLAEVISHLPEETAEALSEKLAETLKEFAEIAAALLPEMEDGMGDAADPESLAQVGGETAEIEFLLASSFEDPATERVAGPQMAESLPLPFDQTVADEKEAAQARQHMLHAAADQPRDGPIVFHNGEIAVARALIPFAMLPYPSAANEITSETEENRRPFEREDQEAQDSAGQKQEQQADGEEKAEPETSADDLADNEAYQLYVRMGGIL